MESVVASRVIWFVFRKIHSINNKSLVSLFVVRATHSCLKYVYRKRICASSLCASSLFQQIVNFLVQIECFYMITWTLMHKKKCTSIFFGLRLKNDNKLMSCIHYNITFISLQYLLHLVCRWKNGWIEEFL